MKPARRGGSPMSFMSRSFGQLGSTVLDDDRLAALAPSIFAGDKHESRSERYSYIPTAEILAGMRAEGFEPTSAKQGHSRVPGKADFTKHMIRFRHRSNMDAKKEIGAVYPEVVIVNSHDGTSAYKVMAGLFRLVCLNGLLVSDRELSSVTVHHKGNVREQVIEGSYRVLQESRHAVEVAEHWSGLTLTQDMQNTLAESARVIRFGDESGEVSTPITADDLLRPRRRDDVGNDLWRTANRIQENVIRGGQSTWGRDANNRRRRVTTREVKGIDADVKINRALWMLNERMAGLLSA
ncbi:hypothetical protein FHR90_003068 [Endobacter medicaginis]|uniref:DUF945 domain-containing protein n=2 Tax=Endobacter medicaginis TaxID=1181271 RepID=A0A839V433_9PROT|nr:DUF932 domain-containing protein [Endobacter medicaginis]MBB3175214.1 hypothetical protein [Endobacter medicaginis]MCX5476262.1 DUF932 domain-containing protein [Endobacter medicaginis]